MQHLESLEKISSSRRSTIMGGMKFSCEDFELKTAYKDLNKILP